MRRSQPQEYISGTSPALQEFLKGPFTKMTERLLKEKRVNGYHQQFAATAWTSEEYAAMNAAFENKMALKGDRRRMLWPDWLVESLFPTHLYKLAGGDLLKMCADPRSYDIAGFSGNYNNSFGRMSRPRKTVPGGFAHFLLERWGGKYRGMPHFFFDVEHPEWVCEPLVGRPDIPKTGRTAVSCVMLYGFQWLNERAHITIMLRHLNWSHGWGDVFGGYTALKAVCEQFKPALPLGNVTIFANSASMDEPRRARHYLNHLKGTAS